MSTIAPSGTTLTQQWTRSLTRLITNMPYPDLIHQFVHAFMSDRALLPMQWAHSFMDKILFKPEMRNMLHRWFDDLLFTPLYFELVWTIPEHLFLENPSSLFSYGHIYCFNRQVNYDPETMLWKNASRPLSSLDGYTLCLLSELIKRQKKPLNVSRVQLHNVHISLLVDTTLTNPISKPKIIPEQEKNKEREINQQGKRTTEEATILNDKLFATRSRLFSHIILSLLSLPFVASHIPGHELETGDSNSIHSFNINYMMSIVYILLSYFNSKCSSVTSHKLPSWYHQLNLILCQFHMRSRDIIHDLFSAIGCSCALCLGLKRVLLTFVPFSYHFPGSNQTALDMSTLLLQLHYEKTATIDPESQHHTENEALQLNQLFHDTLAVRMYTQFTQGLAKKKEMELLKRKREEELEPWKRNVK